MEKKTSFFKSRKFKYGSLSTGLTVAFIAVVIIVNVIFTLLADTYSWKLDMTSYDLYSISDNTKQIVRSLTKDNKVTFTIMYKEDEYPEQFSEVIKRFANLSDKIEYTFIDVDVNPSALTSYGSEYSIEEGSIVVQSKDRIRVVPFEDLYETDSETGAVAYKTEESLAAAMLYVTKEEIPLVYFLTGHGEAKYESLLNLFANNGSDVEEVRLSQVKEFDEQARCLVICGPTMDYSESEIRKLQDFLANEYNYERNLFYFSNPESPDLPNLNGFLAEWGIKINHNVVLESDENSASAYAAGSTPGLFLIPSYSEKEINGQVLTADYLSVVPNASSVSLLFEADGITETFPLLITSADSYAKDSGAINSGYDKAKGDAEGPFNVAVLSTRYKYQDNVPIYSHVFAAGSVDMLNEYYLNYNGNGNYLYEIYKMMVGEDELEIDGAVKSTAIPGMTLSTAVVRWTSIIFIGVIPGIFLIIGLVVYIRRRYL